MGAHNATGRRCPLAGLASIRKHGALMAQSATKCGGENGKKSGKIWKKSGKTWNNPWNNLEKRGILWNTLEKSGKKWKDMDLFNNLLLRFTFL